MSVKTESISSVDSKSDNNSNKNSNPLNNDNRTLDEIERSMYIPLSDFAVNPVYEAGPNHHEVTQRQLTNIEQFYVDVANVFAHQEREKLLNKTNENSHSADNIETSPIMPIATLQQVEKMINMARFQVDNITNLIEQVIKKQTLTTVEKSNLKDIVNNNNNAMKDDNATSNSNSNSNTIAEPTKLAPDEEIAHKNSYAVLLQAKKDQFESSKSIFDKGIQMLNQARTVNSTHIQHLQHLSNYWTIRAKPTQQSNNIPPLVVDYRIGWLGNNLDRGTTLLQRNNKTGQIFIDENVGSGIGITTPAEAINLYTNPNTNNSNLENKAPTIKLEANSNSNANLDESKVTTDVDGWRECAARLHLAQHSLLYKQLYSYLMREARDNVSISANKQQNLQTLLKNNNNPLFHTAILHHNIVITSPPFNSFTIQFPYGPNAGFTIDSIDSHSNNVLVLSCLQLLFTHYQRNAEHNRPTLLHITDKDWHESPPLLLNHIVNSILHNQLVKSITTIINNYTNIPGYHIDIHKSTNNANQLFQFAFTIKLNNKFCLQATIHGTHLSVVNINPPNIHNKLAQNYNSTENKGFPSSALLFSDLQICTSLAQFEAILQRSLKICA